MEYIHNNLMKLGGSLGNVPQKMKNLLLKLDIFQTVSPFSRVQFILILDLIIGSVLFVFPTT
jgi:hypothetical protein